LPAESAMRPQEANRLGRETLSIFGWRRTAGNSA
jgi:hypothetical protein